MVARIERRRDEWTTDDLFDEETTVGPLISENQAEYVVDLVGDAGAAGAALADVPRAAHILTEEQFGPVAAVTSFADERDAVDTANEGELALDASVFTSDHDRAMRVADRVDAGAVSINRAPSHGIGDIPYGGNGDSGTGREGIHVTVQELTREKSMVL